MRFLSELTEECVINWSVELTENLRSRLYALWNRTAGDCLLDSVLQATWGILDIDNTMRRALSDSLLEARNRYVVKYTCTCSQTCGRSEL